MSIHSVLSAFAEVLHSPEFREVARHPDRPKAFTRQRKLPLVVLVATMITGLRMRIQTELDHFFAFLLGQAAPVGHVSEQAFAKARQNLDAAALPWLNRKLIDLAESHGMVPRWRGLRLVAADGSIFHPGIRACHQSRARLASKSQHLLGFYIPNAELMLDAFLFSDSQGERQVLFEHLDILSSTDLLIMDRGYMATWLVAALNQRKIPFCLRVDKSNGWACVTQFIRSGKDEAIVELPKVSKQDALDFECPRAAVRVRLVRHVSPNGKIRVLMTNLMDSEAYPASVFGELYHRRWRIEEAFKRLKQKLNLEHVSGLSQLAVEQDVAAKVLCDNLQSLACATACLENDMPENRQINRASAYSLLRHLIPAVLLAARTIDVVNEVLKNLTRRSQSHKSGRSSPRNMPSGKPHKRMNQKPC